MTGKTQEGLLYGIAAYVLWGVVPFYFAPLMRLDIAPGEALAHRVVWSFVFIAPMVTLAGRWGDVGACLRCRAFVGPLFLSALLISGNWLVYILCVAANKIVHASLGYYLTPLVSVLLGRVFFSERLRAPQGVALLLAVSGVLLLIVAAGEFPWLGLTLAFSFGFYGLMRKKVAIDGLAGLTIETMLLMPLALGFLITWGLAGFLAFGTRSRGLDAFIACGGAVTAMPLLCFGQAARRLSLTTLGFLQYLSPSLQFVFAVVFFDEPLTQERLASFLLIWVAVALFAFDSWRVYRQEQREPEVITET